MNSSTPAALDHQSWRADFVTTLLRLACILGIAVIAILFFGASLAERILFVSLYIILLTTAIAPVKYSFRVRVLMFATYVIGVYSTLAWGPWLGGGAFFTALVGLAALLFDRRADIIALAATTATLIVISILHGFGIHRFAADVPTVTAAHWVAHIVGFSATSHLLITAINRLKNSFTGATKNMEAAFQTLAGEREQLENQTRERMDDIELRDAQIHSTATLAKAIAEAQSLQELMEAGTRSISDHYGYYHVGLYLLDERKKNAFLQASSSAAGKQFIGQGLHIEPDRLNPFNQAVEQSRPYIVSDTENANFIRDINFPLTRSRMILPLVVRNDTVGVLDVHSEQQQAFSLRDMNILQPLINLIAISMDNLSLLDETRNLANQLEANSSAQIRQTWTNLTNRRKSAYQYTPAGVRPIFAGVRRDHDGGLDIPLLLHGQNIGKITLVRKGAAWSERERILVEKVADQVTLALENSRLVDETQKSALRDKVIANISARIRQTLDVEAVLRTAATELRRVFDLKEAEISIGTDQAENTPSTETA